MIDKVNRIVEAARETFPHKPDRIIKKGYSVDSSSPYRLWCGPALMCLIRSLYGTGSTTTACCISR